MTKHNAEGKACSGLTVPGHGNLQPRPSQLSQSSLLSKKPQAEGLSQAYP